MLGQGRWNYFAARTAWQNLFFDVEQTIACDRLPRMAVLDVLTFAIFPAKPVITLSSVKGYPLTSRLAISTT